MINKAKASTVEMKAGGLSSGRPKWRRFALLGGVIVVVLAIALDTKVVRIGSSEDLRQAGFSAAVSANAELEALGEAPDILVAQVTPATAHLDPTPCRRKDLYGAPPSLCHVLEL